MITVVIQPWLFCRLEPAAPQSGARPPTVLISRHLMRLHAMLMRDEQVRPRPAITLPHLNSDHPSNSPAHEPAPSPPSPRRAHDCRRPGGRREALRRVGERA